MKIEKKRYRVSETTDLRSSEPKTVGGNIMVQISIYVYVCVVVEV